MKVNVWFYVNMYLSMVYIIATGKTKYEWRETKLHNWIVNHY